MHAPTAPASSRIRLLLPNSTQGAQLAIKAGETEQPRLRAGARENINTILSNLLTGGNSILHDVEAALPPVPTLPAGLQLPIIGEPMTTVQTSG